MFDEGSATKAEQGAVCDGNQPLLSEWFCCWDTLEALARDAGKLHEKCGSNCSAEELGQWRERVLAQLKTVLADEQRIFDALSNAGEDVAASLSAALGNAA